MSDDLTRGQAEAVRDSLDELWTVIDHANEHVDLEDHATEDECEPCTEFVRDYGGTDPMDVLNERPLAVEWELGEPFAVVLGVGGPHTEITGGGRASGSGYVLTCYWGGDTAHARGTGITRTGEYFRELVESS
jgi:hypothetical protein